MHPSGIGGGLLAMIFICADPAVAQERTVLEKAIAERNPCRGLRTDALGVEIGLDVLGDVTLEAADLSFRDDAVTVALSGRLSCRTSDDALVQGEAAASVRAEARLSLGDCSIEQADVALSAFDGEFGDILEALAPLVEEALKDEARDALVRACRDLDGG